MVCMTKDFTLNSRLVKIHALLELSHHPVPSEFAIKFPTGVLLLLSTV